MHIETHELRQSGCEQDYLNEIHRFNSYAKITDAAMINIIINKLSGSHSQSMADYKQLRSNPTEWKA